MADSRQYICEVCNKGFKHFKHRTRHEKQVHNDGGKVECKDCGAVFSRQENLNRHRRSHESIPLDFQCNICEKTFGRKDSLNQHQRHVHGGVRFECKICATTFAQKYKLKKHMEKHLSLGRNDVHKKTMDHSSGSRTDECSIADAGPSTSKQCEIDKGRGKQTRSSKRRQRKRKANLSLSKLNSTDSSDTDQRSTSTPNKAPTTSSHVKSELMCNICDKTFTSRYGLCRHIEEAHNYPSIQCPQCPKQFKRRENMREHLDAVHDVPNASTSIECPYCNKKFSTSRNKARHIRDVHRKKEKFSCPNCSKKFSRHENLESHLWEVHLNQNSFSCSECSKTYARKGNLQRHINAVHQAKKSFFCLECPEAFSRQEYLNKHMKRGKHSFYEYCKYCDQVILFKSIHTRDSHFVKRESFSWIDKLKGFSKDTCVNILKREMDQLEEFKQGSTTCIHCDEVVPNKNYNHWIHKDFEAPEKSTCINNLKKRPHMTCWMCKEKLFPKPISNLKPHDILGVTLSTISTFHNLEPDRKWTKQKVFAYHYNNFQDPSSCRVSLRGNRAEYEKKCRHIENMIKKRREEIVNSVPRAKKMATDEFEIAFCNSKVNNHQKI